MSKSLFRNIRNNEKKQGNMTSQKINNPTLKDLKESKVDEI
jgi:hypothetical protein